MQAIRILVGNREENEEVEDEEYRVDSGRGGCSHREQECAFGMKLKHPQIGTIKELPFAINQPIEGLILIKTPSGMIILNRRERKNIIIKAGKDNQIVLQPEDSVIFQKLQATTLKDWAVEEKGSWKSIEASLNHLFSKSNELPPSDGFQIRVNLQPDVHSLRLRLGSDVALPAQLSFDVSLSKLPKNQTWYFDIKLVTVATDLLILKGPKRYVFNNLRDATTYLIFLNIQYHYSEPNQERHSSGKGWNFLLHQLKGYCNV